MYKVLIETSLNDLLIILIKNSTTIGYVHKQNLVKKSETLPNDFAKLLSDHHLQTKDIEQFYITLGPGSFMGARVSLVFVRTICQITLAELWTTSSLMFISGGHDGKYYIDAKSNQSYEGIVTDGQINIQLTSYNNHSVVNYQMIIDNVQDYLQLFSKETNLLNIKPLYLKSPKVG